MTPLFLKGRSFFYSVFLYNKIIKMYIFDI